MGILLSKLPLSPKFAKMLVVSTKYQVLKFIIMIVACLSVTEIFREVAAVQTGFQHHEADESDPDL